MHGIDGRVIHRIRVKCLLDFTVRQTLRAERERERERESVCVRERERERANGLQGYVVREEREIHVLQHWHFNITTTHE